MGGFFPEPREKGDSRGNEKDAGSDSGSNNGADRKDKKPLPEGSPRSNRELAYYAGGVVGVNPKPFTLRELSWMMNARDRKEWDRASMIIAKIHNANCAKVSDCIQSTDIHPYYCSDKTDMSREPTQAELAELRSAFR